MTAKAPTRRHPTCSELLQQERSRRLEAEQRLAATEKAFREYEKRSRERILDLERKLQQMGYKDLTPRQAARLLDTLPLFEYAYAAKNANTAEATADSPPNTETEKERITYTRNKKGTGTRGRKGLPADLERRVTEYPVDPKELPALDPDIGWTIIDYDTSEELHYRPASFWVEVHRRPVVAYVNNDGEPCLITVGEPNKVFDKCMASPELLARIAVDRLDRALTLYRIERWFKDHHCPLSRGTLCIWMMKLGQLLEPIARAQMREIMNGFKIHTDDTNVDVLAPGNGATQKVKVWVLIGGEEDRTQIVYVTTPSRTTEEVLALFGGYEGYLQVDACGVYDALFKLGMATEVGCMSHVFRKFADIVDLDRRARPMLKMIRELCDVEEQAKEMSPEDRKFYRLKHAWPILDRIKTWVEEQRDAELLTSNFKLALNYVHNQWLPLIRYLQDGRLRMDNNLSESDFHVFGVTRRNHLYWGEQGLPYGLVLFGLIRTCRIHGIDPYEYLRDIIGRVDTTSARDLTPPRWKELRAEEAKAAEAASGPAASRSSL
jgi:transposase